MACATTLVINDTSNTNLWNLEVESDGVITLSYVGPGSQSQPLLFAAAGNGFGLTLTADNLLSVAPYAGLGAPTYYLMATSAGDTFTLYVDPSGLLFTRNLNTKAVTLVAGQIFTGARQSAITVQPGGPGTPVTVPGQFPTDGSYANRFTPGCSHKVMTYEVVSCYVNCQLSVLVLCPLCAYIQRIMTPDDFYSQQNPILIA